MALPTASARMMGLPEYIISPVSMTAVALPEATSVIQIQIYGLTIR